MKEKRPRTGKIPLLESQIQRQIKDYLEAKGFKVRRNKNEGTYDPVNKVRRRMPKDQIGIPDLTAVIPPNGRIFDIEVKRPGKKATQEQLDWLYSTVEAGGIGIVADCLEDVIEIVEDLL